MKFKNVLHLFTIAATPVGVGMAGFFIAMGYFAAAFWAMVFVVLCMETRVRAGFSFTREPMFWARFCLRHSRYFRFL